EERARRSLDVGVESDNELSAKEPDDAADASDAWVTLALGSLARGVITPLDGAVYLTEEEVFGHRAHGVKARSAKRGRAVLEDLRALTPGDHIVHVEHG